MNTQRGANLLDLVTEFRGWLCQRTDTAGGALGLLRCVRGCCETRSRTAGRAAAEASDQRRRRSPPCPDRRTQQTALSRAVGTAEWGGRLSGPEIPVLVHEPQLAGFARQVVGAPPSFVSFRHSTSSITRGQLVLARAAASRNSAVAKATASSSSRAVTTNTPR